MSFIASFSLLEILLFDQIICDIVEDIFGIKLLLFLVLHLFEPGSEDLLNIEGVRGIVLHLMELFLVDWELLDLISVVHVVHVEVKVILRKRDKVSIEVMLVEARANLHIHQHLFDLDTLLDGLLELAILNSIAFSFTWVSGVSFIIAPINVIFRIFHFRVRLLFSPRLADDLIRVGAQVRIAYPLVDLAGSRLPDGDFAADSS